MKGEIAAALIASVFCSAGTVMYCCTCKHIVQHCKQLPKALEHVDLRNAMHLVVL